MHHGIGRTVEATHTPSGHTHTTPTYPPLDIPIIAPPPEHTHLTHPHASDI